MPEPDLPEFFYHMDEDEDPAPCFAMTNPYVTGHRPPASAHMLWDLGELHSLTERDSSFPCSTPGAVPSFPTHIHELISLSQPVYGQAGVYKKNKRQYLTHDV